MDHKIVKTELFDINMMENLASHDGISVDVKTLLKAYKKKREDGSKVQVIYEYGKNFKKLKLGRLYPQKGLGLQNFPSDVRSALAQKYYHDIDMVNSQPTILSQLCEKNGWACDHLKDYVDNRAIYLEEIMKHKNCDRDAAKTLCISIMFGAKPSDVPKCIQLLVNELDKISTNAIKQFPELYALCKKLDKENPKASCLANVLQDIEFKILREIDVKLQERDRSMDVFIHDGGLVRRIDDEKEFPKEILEEISAEIKESTGYSIKLSEKPLQHSFEFKKDVIRCANVLEREYQQRKELFEETHFYCSDTSTICLETDKGLIHISKADARETLAKFNFQKIVDNTVRTISFVGEWLKDPTKRMINKLVFEPEKDLEIKEDEYNLFRGFEASQYQGVVNEKDAILDRFKIIIEQNAGKKTELVSYITNWFAHLVQYPTKIPGVAIVLINTDHGTGKDTLGNFIGSRVIGDSYFKNIINVETELFDSHSIAFDKTLFMKLEEVNGAANRKFSDMLKSMITAKQATINPKGMKKYTTNVYPHMFMTTNNVTPVKIEPNDRRFFISYTSSDYRADREFWKETHRLFDLPEAGAVVYEYLMNIDLSKFIVQDFPKTEYRESLALMETPSEVLFLRETESFEALPATELFEQYHYYCEENHLTPKTLIGFSRALSPLIEQKIIIRRLLNGKNVYSKV